MKLSDILKNVDAEIISGEDTDIKGLAIDSRKVAQGSLFVCINGLTVDGHKFAKSAVENGAVAVLCEKDIDVEGTTVIKTENSRKALSLIAKNFYGNPTSKFRLIGITGTNGKTSSAFFMENILEQAGDKCGVIGTVEIRSEGKKIDFDFATSTTPDTIELNELFNILEKNDSVIMEVSSHALELNKVEGCEFDTAIFTNLTQDHLDLHKTMENYCRAKAKLFKMCKRAVINADDEWSDKIKADAVGEVVTFGIEKGDFRAVNIEYFMDKVKFDAVYKDEVIPVEINVPGRFTVYNILGVITAAYVMGIDKETIIKGIKSIKGVPGRIQNVPNKLGFNVIVDYAHTPDGVENIIKSVREFTKGRVITVFGCGGDRDKRKRPIMGEISARLSDFTVITSDNPRTEEPLEIIREIEEGVKPVSDKYITVADRREAIFKAVAMAQKGDSVIIAGKGHENYEIFKDRTIHFDDTEVASEAIKSAEEKQ